MPRKPPPVDVHRRIDAERRPGAAAPPDPNRVVDIRRRGGGFRRPAVATEHLIAERELADLAGTQYGRISSEQLGALGIGPEAIDYRLALGRLIWIHRGVYAVGAAVEGQLGQWMAATLAGGPGSLLSHFSAGGLWDVRNDQRQCSDITVEGSARRHRESGVIAHRMRSMHPDDRAIVRGIPVTSLPLTLLHLAGKLSRSSLERVVVRAARKREFQLETVLALCDRSHGRRGVRALRQIAARDLSAELRTLSELELRFLQLCRQSGIPIPDVNRDVEAFMVDAVWHQERVVVELDGFEFHKLPRDLRRANERNRKLVLAGYKVVRFVWADVVNDSARTAHTVLELLGHSRPSRHHTRGRR